MKFPIKTAIALLVLGGIGAAAYPTIQAQIEERNKPRWRTVNPSEGTIKLEVNATGKVRPVTKVQVGSFISGPLQNLYVEFNQEVTEGEILARIDPRLFQANVDRDEASLAIRKADVTRVKALLQQARNDENRAMALKERNVDFIAQSEMDQVRFNRMSLEAQLTIANASIQQAEATLSNSRQNLAYCEIVSPVDGMIIDRKVEPGQTLAAQFQTPELFVIGVGMRDKMHIFANVDESEIGLIRRAADEEQPVTFSVTAYPDEEFEGKIEEVRFSSTETQNVVTYPVVVGCPNPELKLLPGMTADLTFQIEERENILRVPKAALRFFPPARENVHPDDYELFDGSKFSDSSDKATNDKDETSKEQEENENNSEAEADSKTSKTDSATDLERDEESKVDSVSEDDEDDRRHLWVLDGELLRAVEVEIGISDSRYSEVISSELDEDSVVVVGKKEFGEQ